MDQLDVFAAAIRRLESGSYEGNYGAIGRVTSDGSRARGAYQIMDKYWDAWAAQAGIPGADWHSKAAQDAVARYKFTQYYRILGSWDLVAVAWYAGLSVARKAKAEGIDSVGNLRDVVGTSVADYAQKIATYMQDAPQRYRPAKTDRLAGYLTEDDQAALAAAVSPGETSDRYYAMVTSPNEQIDQFLQADQTAGEQPQADPTISRTLSTIVDRFSNLVAGGRRIPVNKLEGPTLEQPTLNDGSV